MKRILTSEKGFTLLEVLLVVGIIAILAAIVIIAINPTKMLKDGRNSDRRAWVNTILSAVYQYAIDNDGSFPSSITATLTEICQTGVSSGDCSNNSLIDLSVLTASVSYLVSIPEDPLFATALSTALSIQFTNSGSNIKVVAPYAEDDTIEVER